MEAIVDFYAQIDIFLLVLTRIIGILMVVPIFSDKSVPAVAKSGLAFLVTLVIVYASPTMSVQYTPNIIGYGVFVIKEAIVGLIIGFIVYVLFQIFFFVGHLVSMASGLSMSNMFDPTAGQQVPVLGSLYNYTAYALFLVTNGHHVIFKALVYSYSVIPIGTGHINGSIVDQLINMLTNYLIISFKIAAPIIVTMFILDFALGILARTAPQMNMFVIGFPVKIMISLTMISIATVLMHTAYIYVYDQIEVNLLTVIQGMRP